jgi:hypothetical protein
MTRKILCVLSDMHSGSRFGLMPPDIELEEEDENGNPGPFTPGLTASQKYLWEWHMLCLDELKRFAGDDEVMVLHNGDEVQGDKHPEHLVSTRPYDQVKIAIGNLSPFYGLPQVKQVRLTMGTPAHTFLGGSAPMMVKDRLVDLFPQVDTRLFRHAQAEVNGLTVDYAHHGPGTGSRAWLKGNVARYYLQSLMLEDVSAGNEPPGLVLRAHFHSPVTERVEVGGRVGWLHVTPAMCTMNYHATQVARSPSRVSAGWTLFEIIDGKLEEQINLHTVMDVRTRETI